LAIEFDLQGLDDGCEYAGFTPVAEVIVNRVPWPEAFRQITPRGAGGQNPHDPIEHLPIIPGQSTGASRTTRK
jgi:hypothetical protein